MMVAYVDPGLGALIWQTVVSACVGLLFYFQKTRKAIVGCFRRIFGRGNKTAASIVAPPVATEMPATRIEMQRVVLDGIITIPPETPSVEVEAKIEAR